MIPSADRTPPILETKRRDYLADVTADLHYELKALRRELYRPESRAFIVTAIIRRINESAQRLERIAKGKKQ